MKYGGERYKKVQEERVEKAQKRKENAATKKNTRREELDNYLKSKKIK